MRLNRYYLNQSQANYTLTIPAGANKLINRRVFGQRTISLVRSTARGRLSVTCFNIFHHRHRKLRPPAYQRDSLLPALLQAPHQRISLSTQVIYACSLYACKEFYSICQERNIFTRSIVNGVDKYCGLLWTWINRVDGRWMQYISHDYNLTYLSAFQDKVL